jgi:hypothetical protein
MGKLPFWQFYPGDWRKDPGVQALDYETRGIWFEILLLMFESTDRGKLLLNGLPMPDEALANILGLEVAKVQQTVSKLLSYGVASICQNTGALMNRRMSHDEYLRHVRAKAGRLGGKQKASKNIANAKQKVTPHISSSSSSSSSEEKEKETNIKEKEKDFSPFAQGDNGTGQTAAAPKQKKSARKKITEALIATTGENWPSVAALVKLYNDESPAECPAVQQISEARIAKARAYLRQFPEKQFWQTVMQQIRASPFLRGLQKNRNEYGSFKADFDWLLQKGRDGTENVVKVHDGKYWGQ